MSACSLLTAVRRHLSKLRSKRRNAYPSGEMHNYCTPHIIKENSENFLIHRCKYILLSQVYCVWQVVKTQTIILNNPVCVCVYYFFFLWRCGPKRDNHTRYDSSGRVIGSSRRLLCDNTQHSQQTSMPPIPTIPSCERPQTNAFHRAATGIGAYVYTEVVIFLVSRFFHGTQFGKCCTRPTVNCTLTSRFVFTANTVWTEWQNAGGCTDIRSAGKSNNSTNNVQDFDQSDSFSFS